MCSQRRKSARPIFARGSLSWPTATTRDAGDGTALRSITEDGEVTRGVQLNQLAERWPDWPTPTAQGDNRSPEAYKKMLENRKGGPRTKVTALTVYAKSWPTPHANATTGPGSEGRDGGENLQTAVEHWATPTASLSKGGLPQDSKGKRDLRLDVEKWATPTAGDPKRGSQPNLRGETNPSLGSQSAKWATPTSRDWKDGAEPNSGVETNSLLGRQAPRWNGPPTPSTSTDGPMSSPSGPTSRRQLNPKFVFWLMDFPPDWGEPTSSEPEGTPSSESRPPSPSES